MANELAFWITVYRCLKSIAAAVERYKIKPLQKAANRETTKETN